MDHEPVTQVEQPVKVVRTGDEEESGNRGCRGKERFCDPEDTDTGKASSHVAGDRIEP
jgi:hypothetical protein